MVMTINITVVKTLSTGEVFREQIPNHLPNKANTKCPKHKIGDTFISQTHECPKGFCNWAYSDIQKDLVDLHYGSPAYYEKWLKGCQVNYVSCTNGLTPTIFKIERMEDE
jgi:uncharacterized repeat protein (TIGR04076 family)